MEKTDRLHKLIEKIEDYAVIGTLIQQAVYSLQHGGDRPMIPILNDATMTDLLSELFDAAFSTKVATQKKTNDDKQDECRYFMREILDWDSYNIGHKFLGGTKGEKHIDGVIFGKEYYICANSHTKTKDNYPGSKVDKENGYWIAFNIFNMVDDIISIHSSLFTKRACKLEYTGNKTVSNNKPTPFDLV